MLKLRLSENNSKQVSEQSRDICLTSNFESNNPVYTSKNSKMFISSQWATLKMFKKTVKVEYTRMGSRRDAHLTYMYTALFIYLSTSLLTLTRLRVKCLSHGIVSLATHLRITDLFFL